MNIQSFHLESAQLQQFFNEQWMPFCKGFHMLYVCYLDDILVTGETKQEHLQNLEEVLSRLREHGVKLKQDKCLVFYNHSLD